MKGKNKGTGTAELTAVAGVLFGWDIKIPKEVRSYEQLGRRKD